MQRFVKIWMLYLRLKNCGCSCGQEEIITDVIAKIAFSCLDVIVFLKDSFFKMAAELQKSAQSKQRKKKPILTAKLEGCGDSVNMALFVPHEDAVITVSSDKYVLRIYFLKCTIF